MLDFCAACNAPCRLRWVIDGWYSNNPDAARAALIRAHQPVTTAEERAAAQLFRLEGTSYPCNGCGKFAFPTPTRCFSCRKSAPVLAQTSAPIAATKSAGRTLEDLRAIANKRPHRCAGYGCEAMIPGAQLMCADHFALLPAWLQTRVTREYEPRAATAWPVDLVAEAIRYTLTEGDLSSLVGAIEGSHQRQLFVEVG